MGDPKPKKTGPTVGKQVLHALRESFVWDSSGEDEVTLACGLGNRVLEWVFSYPDPPVPVLNEIRHAHLARVRFAEAARAEVAELLRIEPRFWREHIAAHPEVVSFGLVTVLLDSADSIKHLPVRMHELTSLAIEIVEAGDFAKSEPIAERWAAGRAWRFHAVALDGLTRYGSALEACKRAEDVLASLVASDHELAIVHYMKATLLGRLGELDTALSLIKDAARVFAGYGDKKMFVKARTVECFILQRAKRIEETLALCTSLISDAREIGDLETVASLYCNIGDDLRLKGEFSRATWYLRQSLTMFQRRGMLSDVPRPRIALAHMRAQQGDLRGALSAFWTVHEEFTNLRMLVAAANVQLLIIEILLGLGEVREAKSLCVDLPDLYIANGFSQNAQIAGAYLRECAQLDEVRVPDVQHVRLYLQDLPQDPTRPFTPLPRKAGR
ncbi:MAG: hypothetical protein JWO56_1075 [Acidobacteria bacterium]|nr:hypothetical protein [Acidobacteriota bacterium]